MEALQQKVVDFLSSAKNFVSNRFSGKKPLEDISMDQATVNDVEQLVLQQQQQQQQQVQPEQTQQQTLENEELLEKQQQLENDLDQRDFPMRFQQSPVAIDYKLELMNLVDRNSPQGFPEKFQVMLPYLCASFIAWPTYWVCRGLYWQRCRGTERIASYIQRTFQHAKSIQVAILATGLVMTSLSGPTSSLTMHEVANDGNEPDIEED